MAGKIFVNYRRDDERSMAARIRDRLAMTFGNANVFMDVDNLEVGQRFDKELEKALNETHVFISVIGPRWMDSFNHRLAGGELDYVREEIANALKRGITIIPVLIDRAPLPLADALPEDVRGLVLHQKHDVSHERFGRDIDDLIQAIELLAPTPKEYRRYQLNPLRLIQSGCSIATGLLLLYLAFRLLNGRFDKELLETIGYISVAALALACWLIYLSIAIALRAGQLVRVTRNRVIVRNLFGWPKYSLRVAYIKTASVIKISRHEKANNLIIGGSLGVQLLGKDDRRIEISSVEPDHLFAAIISTQKYYRRLQHEAAQAKAARARSLGSRLRWWR